MPVHGKKHEARKRLVPKKASLTPQEAISSLKKACTEVPRKFDETVEAAYRLGIDPKKPEQQLRGTFVLPHGTGRTPRIVVFAQGDKVKEAEEAGADFVGGEDLATKIQGGWLEFDVAMSTPDMMKVAGKLGKILGPRGLMPNPKSGTVTFNLKDTVREFKMGKIEYRSDASGIVAVPIGKISFDEEKLVENLTALHGVLVKAKPAAAKGQYIRSIAISATMGPGLKITPSAL
jgi:large subunit ribosomal protein L1